MDKDSLQVWLVIVSIAAVIFGFGWYGAANNSDTASVDGDSSYESDSGISSSEYEDTISDYQTALTEANQEIEEANSCTDEAFTAFDYGDFDEGMSVLDGCRFDEVSEP